MKTSYNLATMPDLQRPISLAVGTFDGVHLGHRFLIQTMKRYGTSVVFTFPNHPRTVLNPKIQIPVLSPENYKLKLLSEAGVDYCLMQSFSKDMADMSYNLFLEEIYTAFPFEHIFFGENDVIGKNREGTKEKIERLGHELKFEAHYLPKLIIDNDTVSSSLIREFLKKGDFQRAEKLLGRKFQISTIAGLPYVDPLLITPADYKLQVCSSNRTVECRGKVRDDGSITFDTSLPFDSEESVTIIFAKD